MSGSTVFLGSKKEFFEKQNQRRVVISGHGLRLTIDKKITVPSGITLYFYCLDGAFTADTLGQAIEGFTGTGNIPQPMETVKSGESVWNYRLTYGVTLTINASKLGAKYNLITIDEKDQNRAIPLSILFRDSRCQNAEIHWACCREIKPVTDYFGKVGGFNTFKAFDGTGVNMTDVAPPPNFSPT